MLRARVIVSGRVQGVWFRETCKRHAVELGVTGWVRNREDGRVEAVFEGLDEGRKRRREERAGVFVDFVQLLREGDVPGAGGGGPGLFTGGGEANHGFAAVHGGAFADEETVGVHAVEKRAEIRFGLEEAAGDVGL